MNTRKLHRSYSWALVRSALIRLLTSTLLLLGLLAPGAPELVLAQGPGANPPPVQVFYVTLPENDAFQAIKDITGTTRVTEGPVYTYFSIAVAQDDTWVYYDQWEDGYAVDIANPSPSEIYNSVTNPGGVQIWGNGNAADGCAPNKSGVGFTCTNGNDVLNAGDVIVPYNAVAVPRAPSSILFDAGDKVASTGAVAMARAVWANKPGTLQAFAHEMYPTSEWGLEYEAPVGTGMDPTKAGDAAPYQFEYSGLTIMASQTNTTVQIDADADGTFEKTVTLHQGGSTLVTGIKQGARVLADKPVQVVLLTGDINDNYESRDMTLLPAEHWGSSYWSPVGVTVNPNDSLSLPTRIYLYNPRANGSIYITCEVHGSPSSTITVKGPIAAGDVTYVDLIDGQGGHFYASDSNGEPTTEKIIAVGTVDTAPGDSGVDGIHGARADWSFTLFPDNFLSTEALVGLGLGQDPTYAPTENGSPLWVTAACKEGTWVYVDWNNDGTADPIDTNGDGTAEPDSADGVKISYLESVRLYRPGSTNNVYAQTGARVWSRTASGMGQYNDPEAESGCALALAWGQDSSHATPGAPGLDVGTSVPPLRLQQSTKMLEIVTDNEPSGVVNPGDVVCYNISITNNLLTSIQNVYVYDTVPANMTYVSGTTEYNTGTGWVSIPDDVIGDGFPLDVEGGVLIGATMGPGATWYAKFHVAVGAGDYEEIVNCDTVITSVGSMERCVTTQVATRDWGDLPDTYGTTAAQDGPRHSPDGLRLGTEWDYDVQGQPATDAKGDDKNNIGDEDGVENAATRQEWFEGKGKLSVTVTGGTGCLNAWMDFANDDGELEPDGNFVNMKTLDPNDYDSYTPDGGTPLYSEHIIQNMVLEPGTHELDLEGIVPPGVNRGETTKYYARFRLSPLVDEQCQAVTPWGYVAGGEVEDYLFEMGAPTGVEVESFTARGLDGAVQLRWATVDESDVWGFNLWSARYPRGDKTQLNDGELISSLVAPGTLEGAVYSYRDSRLRSRTAYYYWLEVLDLNGSSEWHGPISAKTK